MKLKGGLTNIFFQAMIVICSGFMVLTQMPSMRQPSKLLVQLILVLSILSLVLNIWNYLREDKE